MICLIGQRANLCETCFGRCNLTCGIGRPASVLSDIKHELAYLSDVFGGDLQLPHCHYCLDTIWQSELSLQHDVLSGSHIVDRLAVGGAVSETVKLPSLLDGLPPEGDITGGDTCACQRGLQHVRAPGEIFRRIEYAPRPAFWQFAEPPEPEEHSL